MLLRNLYPGYTFLEKLCFLPLSRQHNPEEFYHIISNGLIKGVSDDFISIEKEDFEVFISMNFHLQETHVEFYSRDNTYWSCSENIEGISYSLCVVMCHQEIRWVFLSRSF